MLICVASRYFSLFFSRHISSILKNWGGGATGARVMIPHLCVNLRRRGAHVQASAVSDGLTRSGTMTH